MTAAVNEQSRAQARVGQVLKDKWRLDALLGVGGMAVVYSATHRNNKRVAIKMLLPQLANVPEFRDRFIREGYAANTIEHHGALSVLDDDVSEEGLPFLIMELLDGETVEAYWQRKGQRLEIAEVLTIAGAVLDVLASAHAKGVVHRDIKPENLFLVRTGGLKVLDFGIARVMQETQSGTQTRVGTVMGTPAFMAPEQALAKWDDVDGRTDLWAVGATMFTLASGQHVHEAGSGNEQFVKSATQPARSIATCTTGLPRSVVALIDRALRFDRSARWSDARAMQEAVRGAYEALTGQVLLLDAPSTGPRSGTTTAPGAPAVAATVPSAVAVRPPPARMSSGSFPGPASGPGQPPARVSSGSFPGPVSGVGPAAPRSATIVGGVAPPLPQGRTRSGSIESPPRRPPSAGGLPAASRRSSGSFEAADPSIMDMGTPSGRGMAPPEMTALGVDAFVAGRTAERDAAVAEVARYQPAVAEVQGRVAAVRRHAAQVQEQIAGIRKERTAEEERFRRQMNARLEGVGEARKEYRAAMGEVARIALQDAANFPAEVGAPERAAIEKTRAIAATRARDAALHQAALTSFDGEALKRGILLAAAATILFLLLFFSPVIVRSCSSDTGTIGTATTTTSP